MKEKLQGHNVQFETKKSEGVRLTGHEIPKRHLFVNVLLQNIAPDNFFDWLKRQQIIDQTIIDLFKEFLTTKNLLKKFFIRKCKTYS